MCLLTCFVVYLQLCLLYLQLSVHSQLIFMHVVMNLIQLKIHFNVRK